MRRLLTALRALALRRFPVLEQRAAARQFVKFCLVGGTNVVLFVGLYLLLTRVFQWYFLAASIAGFFVAVTWSFYWNRRWTFRIAGPAAAREYRRFVITNATSGFIQNALLYFLVEGLHWFDLAALALVIVLATFWNFILSKHWAFRR